MKKNSFLILAAKKFFILVTLFFGYISIIATGGGGGGGSDSQSSNGTSPSADFMIGTFFDGPVDGLNYRTDTYEGLTNSNGNFKYKNRENIQFYIGDIFIGETLAKENISPIDLSDTLGGITEDNVVNKIRFLQSIDNDCNLSNGIQISETSRNNALGYKILFNDTVENFAGKQEVAEAITAITSNNVCQRTSLVSEIDALSHYKENLLYGYGNEKVLVAENIVGFNGAKMEITDPNSKLTGLYVNFPVGVLSEEVNIKIHELKGNIANDLGDEGLVVNFEPSGLIFDSPIEIGMPYNDETNIGLKQIYYFSPEERAWIPLPVSRIDRENKIIISNTTHFSTFVIKKAKIKVEIQSYNYDNWIAAGIKVLTPLNEIEFCLPNAITYDALTVKHLIYNRPMSVNALFKVKLREKENKNVLEEKEIKYSIEGKWSDTNDYIVAAYNEKNERVFTSKEERIPLSDIDRYFSGDPVLFVFDTLADPNKEYYFDVELYYINDKNHVFSYTFFDRDSTHFVTNKSEAKRLVDMEDPPDINRNRIHDNYEIENLPADNHNPYEPSNPKPINNQAWFDGFSQLSWNGGDPDNDYLCYHIYLSEELDEYGNPFWYNAVCNEESFQLGGLKKGALYYWQILAVDELNAQTKSEVWKFATKDDHGQTFSTSTDLGSFNSWKYPRGSLDYVGDIDLFKFTLTNAFNIVVESMDQNLCIGFYYKDNRLIEEKCSHQSSDGNIEIHKTLDPDDYYVCIQAINNEQLGPYSVTIRHEDIYATLYRDRDKDGYGDPDESYYLPIGTVGCVLNSGDCNDGDASVHPGATEICGDGIDQDCSGADLACSSTWYKDSDGDGYSDGTMLTQLNRPNGYYLSTELTAVSGDCNDGNASVHPGATEICGDGIDQDCSGADLLCFAPPLSWTYSISVGEKFINSVNGEVTNYSNPDCMSCTVDYSVLIKSDLPNIEISNAIDQGGNLPSVKKIDSYTYSISAQNVLVLKNTSVSVGGVYHELQFNAIEGTENSLAVVVDLIQ